eukprot:CAMPEP_0184311976 /NCGR_PEP_ID=MMETSP1049-20130417/46205_1 /TAXON_ID=77928 /ORGANISM="Proteomonas sulcata, Strain CCMP704" /LENGTH=195 /DNA_ID=CAMNT_0026627787 /DNA_START=156 /DNA_END=743 /DNA_ORIENTATION=+
MALFPSLPTVCLARINSIRLEDGAAFCQNIDDQRVTTLGCSVVLGHDLLDNLSLHRVHLLAQLAARVRQVDVVPADTKLIAAGDDSTLRGPNIGVDPVHHRRLANSNVLLVGETVLDVETGHDGVARDVDDFARVLVTLPEFHLLRAKTKLLLKLLLLLLEEHEGRGRLQDILSLLTKHLEVFRGHHEPSPLAVD